MDAARRFFIVGTLAELFLLLAGLGLCRGVAPEVLEAWRWNAGHALAGAAAVPPLLLVFVWACRSPWAPLRRIRLFLEQTFLPMLSHWSVGQIFLLSMLAGVGEELMFRGAVQGGLAGLVGTWPAMVLASLMFGLCHAVTWAYIWLASLMGLYFGLLLHWSDNLLVPMTAHFLYDFVALLHLRPRLGAPRS